MTDNAPQLSSPHTKRLPIKILLLLIGFACLVTNCVGIASSEIIDGEIFRWWFGWLSLNRLLLIVVEDEPLWLSIIFFLATCIALGLIYWFKSSWWDHVPLLALSANRKVKTLLLACMIGLGLTILSSAYLREGLFKERFGTECPEGFCMMAPLGAGFPLPYFVEPLGYTPGPLGPYEYYLPEIFLFDVCFNTLLAYGGIRFRQYHRQRTNDLVDS